MRRITLKILVSSLTFIIGVGLTMLCLSIPEPPLSLCQISLARYEGKMVRVHGKLSVTPLGAIHLKAFNKCGFSQWANIYFRENPKLIDELQRLNTSGGFPVAEVVVIGRYEDRKSSCPNDYVNIEEAILESSSRIVIKDIPD